MNSHSESALISDLPVTELLSIDSETTKDLDDAMWIRKNDDGYLIDVYIANVAGELERNSKHDLLARAAAFSLYRGARGCVKPMLPRWLSENKLSLIEGSPRSVLGIHIQIDNSLRVLGVSFSQPTIVNNLRLSPRLADGIIANPESTKVKEVLNLMMDVSRGLLNLRREAGALAFYDVAKGIMVDEDGQLIKLAQESIFHSQIVVQEFMILANATCAEYCLKHNLPILYRNHQSGAESPNTKVLAEEIALALEVNDAELIQQLGKRMGKYMVKATIGRSPLGHYALNLPAYAYMTSPIRRYPDLVNQRILLAHIAGNELPYTEDELDLIAVEYNDACLREAESTSQHYKERMDKVCELALQNDNLGPMDETDFYRVVRYLTNSELPIPKVFEVEWLKRIQAGTLTVKLIAALIGGLANRLPESLIRPTLLLLGNSLSMLPSLWSMLSVKYEQPMPVITITEKNGLFEANVTSDFMGVPVKAVNLFEKTRKKAEQTSLLALLHSYFNLQSCGGPTPVEHNKIESPTTTELKEMNPASNYKGELNELCQKSKWPSPEFSVSSSGADHAKTFIAKVTVMAGKERLTATGSKSASKKECEHLAAKSWLESNGERFNYGSSAVSTVSVAPESNPISQLQELSQKGLFAAPDYQFATKGSIFECEVKIVWHNAPLSVTALATTKKEAKTKAATNLLGKLSV